MSFGLRVCVPQKKRPPPPEGGGGFRRVRFDGGVFLYSTLSLKPAHSVRPMPGFIPSARSAM